MATLLFLYQNLNRTFRQLCTITIIFEHLKFLALNFVLKLLLVRILHAIKSGNSTEVTELLTDLKKNRKKRTKQVKIMKSNGNESIHVRLENESSYIPMQQGDYLFPVQQPQQQEYPFQWVGAEEEVRCSLSYNDIRQFIFLNCDRSNKKTLLDQIVDLRTEATVSNYRSSQTVTSSINTSDQQCTESQLVTDSTGKKMSLLLKKMLQAPVGANLGEIASTLTTWPTEKYVRDKSPDDSETMSAKSDINDNDEIWQDNDTAAAPDLSFENEQSYINSYCQRNNDFSYHKSIDNIDGDESILNKVSSILDSNDTLPDLQLDVSRHYETPINIIKAHESFNAARQICMASDGTSNYGQDFFGNIHQQQVSVERQQQNNSRYSDYTELTTPIYHVELDNASYDPGYYHELQSQHRQFSSNSHDQQIIYGNQSLTVQIPPAIDPLQQLQDHQFDNFVGVAGTSATEHNSISSYGTGVLEPYWPRLSFEEKNNRVLKANRQSLEITLNFRTSNSVNFSKLNETCCVYSNKTPVMTLRKGLNSLPLGIENEGTGGGLNHVEDRQHNFISNCLLYNQESNSSVDDKRSHSLQNS